MEYRLVDFGDSISVVSFTITPESACGHAAQVIQNAIDRCADNGGGTVYLEAGEYVLTGPRPGQSSQPSLGKTYQRSPVKLSCQSPVRLDLKCVTFIFKKCLFIYLTGLGLSFSMRDLGP